MNKEIRFINTDLTVRASDDGEGEQHLEGKGVPFNQLSEDLGGFRERISPGAFNLDKTIKSFWSHDSSRVLGSTKSNPPRPEERSDGIHFSLDLPNTTTGRDAFESIQRGDVDGVSFGFFVTDDHIDQVDGEVVRTVLRGELIEISPVAFPAYSQTQISAELRGKVEEFVKANEESVEEQKTEEENPNPTAILEKELDLLEVE